MSIQHIVRCDVVLAGGHRCEARAEVNATQNLPRGWRNLVQYERPTIEDSALGEAQPVIAALKATGDEELVSKVDGLMASIVESMPPVARQAHVCDKHELPAVAARSHMPGCVGY